jgi:uracil-DNA glycosylase family protein
VATAADAIAPVRRRRAPTEAADASPFVPPGTGLSRLRHDVQDCRGCSLYRRATQAVFGQGPRRAAVMLVGEQPGDQEDRQGAPFVGPAGQLLDSALEAAGIARDAVYVTNTVKHFKWEPRGKRRLHRKPSYREAEACRPWLEAELHAVKPQVLVCLGATAAQALLGRDFRVSRQRGERVDSVWAPHTLATMHPSAVLRQRGTDARARALAALVDDLRVAARLLKRHAV